jgi:hypothetical protein
MSERLKAVAAQLQDRIKVVQEAQDKDCYTNSGTDYARRLKYLKIEAMLFASLVAAESELLMLFDDEDDFGLR